MESVQIGICGFGTVGGGIFQVLHQAGQLIERRIGRTLKVGQIGLRRPHPTINTGDTPTVADIFAVARNPDIDIVVEVIGGTDTAKDLVLAAIAQGKHVVTANKALIATHGNAIFQAAQQKGVIVAYEAAVAGGIPIMKTLREGLAANQIHWLMGIINGTSNYILTAMAQEGRAFSDVLAEAQRLGYAEADPTFDIEGIDAAHKLAILAANAFGTPLNFDAIHIEGITRVQLQDIQLAQELGYCIKHLGIAKQSTHGLELRIHPTLIPQKQLLAQVDGVMNAIMVQADALGPSLYYGAGAGDTATASAVVADIVDIVRHQQAPQALASQAFLPQALEARPVLAIEAIESAYYLRIDVQDHPGAMSAITSILSDTHINIDAILQKEEQPGFTSASVAILTHSVRERTLQRAIQHIEQLPEVNQSVVMLRIEHLN